MHVESTFENDIKELDPRKPYKYLGIEESFDVQHKNEKEKLKKEYLRRLRLVLSTELSAKNKIQAIGSLAVPVLRYSFGIINWHQEELQNLDRKTRKLLTIYIIETQRMWNLKCKIVPVIIGATGIVTRSLKKNLEIVPGKHSINSLQKTAILGTSHIIRKVLQCEA